MGHEAAQRYSLRAKSRRQATWITGPTGVTVSLDTDYEMFLLMDDLPGGTERVFAHGVKLPALVAQCVKGLLPR